MIRHRMLNQQVHNPKIEPLNIRHQGKRTITGHYCPDWDFAWIQQGDEEMKTCTCFHIPYVNQKGLLV